MENFAAQSTFGDTQAYREGANSDFEKVVS